VYDPEAGFFLLHRLLEISTRHFRIGAEGGKCFGMIDPESFPLNFGSGMPACVHTDGGKHGFLSMQELQSI